MTYAWRVERDRNAYSGELMPGWVVRSLEDGSFPSYKVWWTHGHFDTWQQAMAKADKESRTVTVTLPRVGEEVTIPSQYDAKDEPPLQVRFTNRMTWIYQHGYKTESSFIVLDVDQLEALALALLTHGKPRRAR